MPLLTLVLLVAAGGAFAVAAALLVRGALCRAPRPITLVVSRREDPATDLFTIALHRPGLGRIWPLPRFEAGQSVALSIPGQPAKRRYSIARWRHLPFAYELSVKREAQGRFSPRLADYARPGALLMVSPPEGRFVLPTKGPRHRAVFIAGGVGITPLLAMIDRWASKSTPYAEAHLYWQVRYEPEALYRETLEALASNHPALRVRILTSRPARGEGERIGGALLESELGSLQDADFFLCAGSSLLDAMLGALKEAGVSAEALHHERFTVSGTPEPDEGWRVTYAGERIPFAGHTSLLDALEEHRLLVDSDCRTGSCGRCLLAIESGEVRHRSLPEFSVPAGHVLTCCAVPKSDLHLRALATQGQEGRA